MRDQLPYEEGLTQQFDNLSLPDENKAWEDMRRRLEEDDDDGIIVWWRRGCMVWGLLLLLIAGLSWQLFQTQQLLKDKNINTPKELATEQKTSINKLRYEKEDSHGVKNNRPEISYDSKKNDTTISVESSILYTEEKSKINIPQNNAQSIVVVKSNGEKKIKKSPIVATKKSEALFINKSKLQGDSTFVSSIPVKKSENPSKQMFNDDPFTKDSARRTVSQDSIIAITKVDSVHNVKKQTDSIGLKKNDTKTDTTKSKNIFFSAGLAMHQQLPIAGQKFTPYSASGRQGSIADYIPSVYFRINKKDKWFIQTEFRYGAPQSTKEFVYDQKAVPDTSTNPPFTRTISSKLKKTFYHQLPITFNYYLKPGWSVGAGLQINQFSAVVFERALTERNNTTLIDTVLSKNIVGAKRDSSAAIKKTYLLGVIETQYQYKRFSAGARYSMGLQPYIKFTLPGSNERKERSSAVQLFVRYQLWRSNKEKK